MTLLNFCVLHSKLKLRSFLYLLYYSKLMAESLVLEQSNLVILQQITANDWALLPLEEIEHLNPNKSTAEVTRTLNTLLEHGYLTKVTVDDVPADVPETYYAVTEKTQNELESYGLWSGMTILYDMYDAVETTERLEHIRPHYPYGLLVQNAREQS